MDVTLPVILYGGSSVLQGCRDGIQGLQHDTAASALQTLAILDNVYAINVSTSAHSDTLSEVRSTTMEGNRKMSTIMGDVQNIKSSIADQGDKISALRASNMTVDAQSAILSQNMQSVKSLVEVSGARLSSIQDAATTTIQQNSKIAHEVQSIKDLLEDHLENTGSKPTLTVDSNMLHLTSLLEKVLVNMESSAKPKMSSQDNLASQDNASGPQTSAPAFTSEEEANNKALELKPILERLRQLHSHGPCTLYDGEAEAVKKDFQHILEMLTEFEDEEFRIPNLTATSDEPGDAVTPCGLETVHSLVSLAPGVVINKGRRYTIPSRAETQG
jgi:hypothetical protein